MKRAVKAAAALACACMCACAPEPASAHSDVLSMAGRWLGSGSPFRVRLPWCAAWLSMILDRSGYQSPHTWAAREFLHYGRRLSGPRPGAIAVISWHGRKPDHVALVEGVTARGIQIISGNYSHRVGRGFVRPWQVMAYAAPVAIGAANIPWPIRHHRHKRRNHRHHRHSR